MSEKLHPQIPELQKALKQGRVSRREFLRTVTLLGASASSAIALAACAPAATPTPAPKPTDAPKPAAPTAAPAATAAPVVPADLWRAARSQTAFLKDLGWGYVAQVGLVPCPRRLPPARAIFSVGWEGP